MKTSVKENKRSRAKRIRDHSYCVDQKHMKPIDPHTELSLSHKNNVPFVQIVMAAVECVCIYSINFRLYFFPHFIVTYFCCDVSSKIFVPHMCSQGADMD